MSNFRRKLLLDAFKLFDLGLMVLAFIVAALAVLHQNRDVSATEFFSMRVKVQNVAIFSLLVLTWHLIFSFSGLYASRRLSDRRKELFDVTKATFLGTLVVLIGATVFRIELVTPLFLIVFSLVSTSSAVSSRLILRAGLAYVRRQGRNLRNVVIVGTNARALEFAQRLACHPESGYRVIGFVDRDWDGIEKFRSKGHAVASDFCTFPEFLRSREVDEVVMALPIRSLHEEGSRIAALCEEQGIPLRLLTNIFNLKTAHSSAEEDPQGDPVITQYMGSLEGWPVFIKRIFDIMISSLLIVWLCPILLVVAILIKLTSPGPVLFVQKRLGLNKRRFDVYKFRTMGADAEARMREIEHLNEVSGPVFKIKNDPRLTPIGRLLRKTSIDELPQVFNVLRGEMSLVGPRPLPLRDYEGFHEDWQRRRFSVKPGITCLWQIRGRSSIPFEQWMELDLQYIDKWSLWLDLEILMRTIPAVLRGSGAA
jgi:exopolysaccharide biosynthesis polyprenyl glycosylphosphotransferase